MHFGERCTPPPDGLIGPRVTYLSKLLRQVLNEAIADMGLFSGQQDIIILLIENDGMTVSELSKRLNVSAATASVSVKRMEKAGFVIKKPDENDARVTRLYASEKAKLAPELLHEKMTSLECVMRQGMTEEETQQLSSLLERAIENMKVRGETDD